MQEVRRRFGFLRSRWIKIFVVLLILFLATFNSMFTYVEPNEFGIKIVRIGAGRGVQEEPFGPGYHFVPAGLQTMETLPRDIQVLELTSSSGTASSAARTIRAAHIQTSDGFFVDVDVSVLYHIEDPYLVFTTIGPGRLYEDNGIIPKAEPALKEALGELTTEDFYNSPLRVSQTEEARLRLNRELENKGIVVDQVLIRYFHYSQEIQDNIEEKKLKDQLVFKNIAEGKAAEAEAVLKRVIQEGEMRVAVKLSEGEAYVTERLAERDLYVRQRRAEADLLIQLAEARRTELRNEALQGLGSDRMVGLKLAEALYGLDVIVLPSDGENGVNPLDVPRLLELFEVRSAQGGEVQ
ncbi:MAG: SPFH domain-containing protein [Desulfovibrio sp.]|nr:MAG: SPFH domain-containing protein [Desulfovibrio sp.]